jgi:TetR/AcrR family transcriptional repressor of nem operon
MDEKSVAATDGLTPKGRATRSRIVRAAAELMYRQGVARTSLDDVRASASVSSSQLYHYFDDKSALVSAVIAHQAELVLGGQQPHLASLDSVPALRAWRDVLVRIRRRARCLGGCPIGSLASELADTDPAARSELADAFRRWEASIRAGLRAMKERGELPARSKPDNLAVALLAAVQGGILLSQIHGRTDPMEVALDTVIEHIASLMKSSPPRDGRPGRRTNRRAVRGRARAAD